METVVPITHCNERTLSDTACRSGRSLLSIHMSEQTIGSFLREKGCNFVRFMNDGLPPSQALPTSFVTEVGMSTFAVILRDNRVVVTHKDWVGLNRLLGDSQLVGGWKCEMVERLLTVKTLPDLHDKFWRYLELFADTVAGDNNPTGQ